jgi:uncharacterized protein (TIGR02688 family)
MPSTSRIFVPFSSADSTLTGIAKDGRISIVNSWMDTILRSVGLEPSKLSHRVKMHFITRLIPLVEPNYNFIELGPRGTGKSYFFSEFSPYSTLISGGQATKATLFYNNQRKKSASLDSGIPLPSMKSAASKSKTKTLFRL